MQRFLVGLEVDDVVAEVIDGQFLLGNFFYILLDGILKFGFEVLKGLFVVAVLVVEVAQLDSVVLKLILLLTENIFLLFGDVPVVQEQVALVTHAKWFGFLKTDLAFLV